MTPESPYILNVTSYAISLAITPFKCSKKATLSLYSSSISQSHTYTNTNTNTNTYTHILPFILLPTTKSAYIIRPTSSSPLPINSLTSFLRISIYGTLGVEVRLSITIPPNTSRLDISIQKAINSQNIIPNNCYIHICSSELNVDARLVCPSLQSFPEYQGKNIKSLQASLKIVPNPHTQTFKSGNGRLMGSLGDQEVHSGSAIVVGGLYPLVFVALNSPKDSKGPFEVYFYNYDPNKGTTKKEMGINSYVVLYVKDPLPAFGRFEVELVCNLEIPKNQGQRSLIALAAATEYPTTVTCLFKISE